MASSYLIEFSIHRCFCTKLQKPVCLIFGEKTWGAAFSDFIREPNSCEGSQRPLPATQTVTDFLKIFWQWGFQNSWERIFRGQEENLSDFLTENSLYFLNRDFSEDQIWWWSTKHEKISGYICNVSGLVSWIPQNRGRSIWSGDIMASLPPSLSWYGEGKDLGHLHHHLSWYLDHYCRLWPPCAILMVGWSNDDFVQGTLVMLVWTVVVVVVVVVVVDVLTIRRSSPLANDHPEGPASCK